MLALRIRSRLGLTVGAGLAVLLLGPLLGPGYVLVRDMVFVPRMPLGRQLLGLDGVPRAVPSDLLVALASRVVAAGWLQDLVLVAIVVCGAWGAGRLVPTASRAGALAAATTYGWSAYLHERLLLGQWALLVGWAVLPWAARAALAWRRGHPGWPAIACLACAATGGASAVLLVGLVVVVCGRPLKALAATALLSLPWALPGLLQPVASGDPAGVAAFAAHADTPLGLLGSLLTGGGVWAPAAVPPGRSAGVVAAVLVLLVAAVGLPRLWTRLGHRLLVAGGMGLLLALLGRLPGLSDALRWAVVHVPAAGLLRDGQKWLAPFVLLTAAAVACGAEVVVARVPRERVRRVAAALVVLAPIAALPGAAWGEHRRLTVSHYPRDWQRVPDQTRGMVLVLPWTLYRAFPWDGNRTVLDPATKLLRRPVVNDDLPLVQGSVRGEDPVAARVEAAVTSGEALLPALRAAGIAQVLVERTTRGADPGALERQTRGLTVVTETDELALYAVPGGGPEPSSGPDWPVVLGDLVAGGYGLLAVVRAVRGRRPY
ncbi:MAG: hypothetical protein JWM02_827 [Frankiales bacterium]|nr:hypothetical protein [Frankiales bacterium]